MWFQPYVSWHELAGLCRRVGTSLDAGLDVLSCFDREVERARGGYRRLLQGIRQDLSVGENLADAVAHADDRFPPLFCQMLRVGEETGHTGQLLLKMAKHYEKLIQLRRIVFTALIKPAIQLFLALAVIGILIWIMGVIPSGGREPIDILGLGLVGNRGLLIYFMFIGAVLLGLTGLVLEWRRGRMGVGTITQLAMRIPAVGDFIRTTAMARMAWALSMTTGAGMDARRSMRTALYSTHNPYYFRHEPSIARNITAGNSLYQSLAQTGAFPAEFLGVVEVGEESGCLSESLDHHSNQLEERADALASGLAVAATFAVWGIVSAFIIFMIFRLASFYLGTINDALNAI